MVKRILLSSIILFFLSASSAKSFGISPTRYLVTIDPGKMQKISLVVQNDEAIKKKFKVSVFGIKQEANGNPVLGVGLDDAEKWIKPETEIFELAQGKQEKIIFNINAPVNYAPGSHFLGLAVDTLSDSIVQTKVEGRLTAILILQVAGVVTEALNLKSVTEKNIYWNKNFQFNLEIKNNGNMELPLQGQIEIRDWRGRQILSEEVSVGNQLLPGASRFLTVKTKASTSMKWPGLYSANFAIKYGKVGLFAKSAVKFWYVDAKFLAGSGLVVLIAVLLWWRRNKKNIQ